MLDLGHCRHACRRTLAGAGIEQEIHLFCERLHLVERDPREHDLLHLGRDFFQRLARPHGARGQHALGPYLSQHLELRRLLAEPGGGGENQVLAVQNLVDRLGGAGSRIIEEAQRILATFGRHLGRLPLVLDLDLPHLLAQRAEWVALGFRLGQFLGLPSACDHLRDGVARPHRDFQSPVQHLDAASLLQQFLGCFLAVDDFQRVVAMPLQHLAGERATVDHAGREGF